MSGGIKIPSSETAWVEYYNLKKELRFIVTSNKNRDFYYLYECKPEGITKLGKSKSPLDLEEKFKVAQNL